MTYRRLTQAELNDVREQFVTFLVAHGIPAEDWKDLKREAPANAEKLIELFSEMVWDQTLEKVRYLEYKEAQDVKCFDCGAEKIEMLGLFIEGHTDVDLRRADDPQAMLQRVRAAGASVKLYSMEKPITGDRKAELFRMMEGGCVISRDGALYRALKQLRPN